MRMALTMSMGWLALPVLAIVAIGYIWIVSALLNREQSPRIEESRVNRAA
jgi:hypothetical protein